MVLNTTDDIFAKAVFSESRKNRKSMMDMFYESLDIMYEMIDQNIHPLTDIVDGFLSAITLCSTGFYEGFRGLFFKFPLQGLTQDGLIGIFGGTLVGTFHFSVMTTSGVTAGLYQMARGLERSATSVITAVRATVEGKNWNATSLAWEYYSLDREASILNGTQSTTAPRRLRKHVKDKAFYDLLEVPVNATRSEIKKAYHRRALLIHPDKSSGTQAATEFQTLNNVYTTLVSEKNRELYDSHGICFEIATASAYIDPYVFFSIMFRSAVVEPYTGTLLIPTAVDNAMQLTPNAEPLLAMDVVNYGSSQQKRRQVDVAIHLRGRIDAYNSGKITLLEFQDSCRAEARSLLLAMEGRREGEKLLRAIGDGLVAATKPYVNPKWTDHLTGWVSGTKASSKQTSVTRKIERVIRSVVLETDTGSESHEESPNTSECDKDKKEANVDALLQKLATPNMMRLVWEFNFQDISRTVREAARRVLDDGEKETELCLLKARALYTLGKEFRSAVSGTQAQDYPETETMQEKLKAALMDSVKTDFDDDEVDKSYE
jgi:curved DNA-binding protein CbpA